MNDAPSSGGRNRTVLIVDDDASIREMLQLGLEMEGIDVVTAENGRAGLDALSKIENPGLILLDLMMPKMNGFEFMDWLREHPRNPAVPIVVMSAFPDSKFSVPVELKLAKPFVFTKVLEIVHKFCK